MKWIVSAICHGNKRFGRDDENICGPPDHPRYVIDKKYIWQKLITFIVLRTFIGFTSGIIYRVNQK